MESFEELLRLAEIAHGHLCAGQILGVRMALLACRRLEVTEPRGADRKKLICFVEIDRCGCDWPGDGVQAGQAGVEVSRLGQDGRDLQEFGYGAGGPDCGARKFSGIGAATVPGD